MILGNYGLSLQLSGELDVVAILNEEGATKAIFSMLAQLPMSTLVIAVFTLLCIIFTATTFDSISYILASVVQNNVTEEPMRWNRMFWAFTLSFLTNNPDVLGGVKYTTNRSNRRWFTTTSDLCDVDDFSRSSH